MVLYMCGCTAQGDPAIGVSVETLIKRRAHTISQ